MTPDDRAALVSAIEKALGDEFPSLSVPYRHPLRRRLALFVVDFFAAPGPEAQKC